MKTVWTALLWLAVTLAVAWLPATAQGANALSGDVLVLDFTGLNDTDARKHARRFAEPLLPDARLYTFGFSGKVPDAQRANEGHNLILRHETEAERLAAARSVVNGFTSGQQTVLAFDINESLIPNQIWGLVPGMADHKVREPALIAAQIAEAWKRQHPNGTLILRGHSDGTEVVRLVVDKLVAQGITPQMVMAESPRATYDQWLLRAAKLADTLFVFINADKDWPRANLVDQGFAKPGLPNMIDYNITGYLTPLRAHGVVTKISMPGTVVRTDALGSHTYDKATIRDLLIPDLAWLHQPGESPTPMVARAKTHAQTTGRAQPPQLQPYGVKPPPQRKRTDDLPPAESPRRAAAPPPPPPPSPPQDTKALPRPGGVDPMEVGTASASHMPHIAGAVIEPGSGRLILLTEAGRHGFGLRVDPNLMAQALYYVYTDKHLAFSLDPDDPANPNGKWLKAVYYPAESSGTSVGKDLFEADLALKCLTFGVRLQGEQVVDHPSQLIESLPQMMSKEPDRPRGPWARIWIVNDVVRLSGSDGVIRVDSIKMAVRARHQVVDRRSNTGLRDVDTDPQSMEARFARRLSERYDELAESEAPALARATEVAKAIAIARWLRDNGAKLDVNGLVPMLNAARVPTVSKITALNVTKHAAPVETLSADGRSKTISQHSINIFGGVDMQVKPQIENNPGLSRLARAVVAAMPRQGGDAVEVRDGDRRYLATALPFRVVMAPSAGADAGIRARYGRGLATR